MKVIKAIYNFIVGDMTILAGVIITIVILGLISTFGALAALRDYAGFLLILAVLVTLVLTLRNEIGGR